MAPAERPAFVLDRPRDLSALLSDSFSLYRSHFWTFVAMAAVVVVPVHAIVLGVGLGQFSGGIDSTSVPAAALIPFVVRLLVVGPLMAVMTLHAVRAIAAGERPRAGASIEAGLDAFRIVFWPVLIAVVLEVGTLLLLVGFVLIVRLYFVPQLVVLERKRGTDALRASWELTRGFAWRTAGLIIAAELIYWFAGGLIAEPLAALAQSMDSEAVALGATTLASVLIEAPLGIFAALLYYDLRARQAAPAG